MNKPRDLDDMTGNQVANDPDDAYPPDGVDELPNVVPSAPTQCPHCNGTSFREQVWARFRVEGKITDQVCFHCDSCDWWKPAIRTKKDPWSMLHSWGENA